MRLLVYLTSYGKESAQRRTPRRIPWRYLFEIYIIPIDVKRENLVENPLAASKLNRGASLRAAAQLRLQPSVYLDGSEDSPHESKRRPEFIMVCLLQPREV